MNMFKSKKGEKEVANRNNVGDKPDEKKLRFLQGL